MEKVCFILVVLLFSSYSAYSSTRLSPSESDSLMILNESMLDSVTAGAISSTVLANAVAVGSAFAKTMADATSYAIATGGNFQTGGQGEAVAQGDSLAFTEAASISSSDTTGVSVEGRAMTTDGSAYTLVWTKVITTGGAEVAIGHVRSIACCGSDTYTSAQTSTFTQKDFSISRNRLNEVNTSHLSISIGNAIAVSLPEVNIPNLSLSIANGLAVSRP